MSRSNSELPWPLLSSSDFIRESNVPHERRGDRRDICGVAFRR
jgi:hypothetical protein